MPTITIRRIYDDVDDDKYANYYRVLVDRIWPRGISKDKAKLDDWSKTIAPSSELRKWFNHDESKFEDFKKKYKKELKDKTDDLKKLLDDAGKRNVLLLYGAKDEKHNQAIILKDILKSIK